MTAAMLPAPGVIVRGEQIGPCETPCGHADCAETRSMAAQVCGLCTEPIGYERRFYSEPTDGAGLVHALCLERSVVA